MKDEGGRRQKFIFIVHPSPFILPSPSWPTGSLRFYELRAHSDRAWPHTRPGEGGCRRTLPRRTRLARFARDSGTCTHGRRRGPPRRPGRRDRSPGPARSDRGGVLGQGQPLPGLSGGHRAHAATFQGGLQDHAGLVRGIHNQHTVTAVQSWRPPWLGQEPGFHLFFVGENEPFLTADYHGKDQRSGRTGSVRRAGE